MKTLKDLAPNQSATIDKVATETTKIAMRLRELGLFEGQKIFCLKKTPFGGPGVYQMGPSLFSLDSEVTQAVVISAPRGGKHV